MALFQAVMKGKLNGQDCVNVCHFTKPDAVQDDMLVLGTKLTEDWIGFIATTQTTNFTWYQLKISHINQNPWAPIVLPLNIGGQFFSSPASWAVLTVVYQFKTANPNTRKGRGRIHISGIYTELEHGVWTAARLGLQQGVANVWKDNFVGDDAISAFNLVIRGRDESEPDVRTVTDIVTRAYPGSQVRRNLFRGQ